MDILKGRPVAEFTPLRADALEHRCTIPGRECKACEALTAAWLDAHDDRLTELPAGGDPYRSGSVRLVSLDSWEDGADAFGSWETDPARRYDTARDAMRQALRMACSDTAPRQARAATGEVLASIRDALRAGRGDGRATVGDTVETIRPAMGRADAKVAARTIRAAYAIAKAEAGEAYRPDGPVGEIGWKVRPTTEARTLAGPVVTGTPAFIVATDGTTTRGMLPVRITRDRVQCTGKGEERARVEWTEILDRAPSVAAMERALTVKAARTDGTTWTPDASTFEADRFEAATAPRGPVSKPNTRKRKRDGRIGGPAVITATPGRGAR